MEKIFCDGIVEAVELVISELDKRGNPAKHHCFVNDNKHCWVETRAGLVYYIVFKREFFMTFGKVFEKEGQKGIGESINESCLIKAEKNLGANLILCVYPDGKIYSLTPREWLRSPLIRETEEKEKTVSVPIGLLRRWK